MRADLSIVIPTHSNETGLAALIESITRQTLPPAMVLVIDNASYGGYPQRLARSLPSAYALRLPRNTFFAEAADVGIRRAATDLVAVINDDVVLDEHWIEVATHSLVSASTAGSLASRIRQAAKPDLLDSAGDHISADGKAGKIGYGMPVATTALESGWVTSASGTCALYRRNAYLTAGGFDGTFRAYLEDVDLGLRLQMLGHRCLYEPDATLSHVGGATFKPRREALWLTERNLARVVLKTFPPPELRQSLRRQLSGPAEILGGSSIGAWLIGKGSAAMELRALLRERKSLRMRQEVSDADMSQLLRQEFAFVGHL